MPEMFDPVGKDTIARNLQRVRDAIASAAAKSSRDPSAARLIAVTKYVRADEIRSLIQLGVTDFGESRVQDAEKKIRELGAAVHWHLIGHLQTNKAQKGAALFQTIHSVDSTRVAEALHKEAKKLTERGEIKTPPSCLLEVNVAGEANKFGMKPDSSEIHELLRVCSSFDGIRIAGLMAMAPHSENPEPVARPVFRRLRELLDEANAARVYPHPLTELSMGMTQDYAIAVEEGATMVRVGSALFEKS